MTTVVKSVRRQFISMTTTASDQNLTKTEVDNFSLSSLPLLLSKTFANIENRMIKDDKSDSLTDDELSELFVLFDETLERALFIIDKSKIKIYRKQSNNRTTIIEVPGSKDSFYRFFPNINYCPCDSYQFQVLKLHCQYTCKHVLAAKIALLTNKNTETEILTDKQFSVIVEHLITAGLK